MRSVDRGTDGWAIELRKLAIRVPTLWCLWEGNTGGSAKSLAASGLGVVEEPNTSGNNVHENRETSRAFAQADRAGKVRYP